MVLYRSRNDDEVLAELGLNPSALRLTMVATAILLTLMALMTMYLSWGRAEAVENLIQAFAVV